MKAQKMLRILLLLGALLPAYTFAHAHPDDTDPKADSTLATPPTKVRITFDSVLENNVNTIQVKDSNGKRVDKNDLKLVDSHHLEIGLQEMNPRSYQVIWKIVARDGHHTNGDYNFTVK